MSLSELTAARQSVLFFPLVLILAVLLGSAMSFESPLMAASLVLFLSVLVLVAYDIKVALLFLILLRINLDAFHQQMNLSLGFLRTLSLPSALGSLILLLGFFHVMARRIPFWRYPLVKPFGIFLLACGVSLPLSGNLTQGVAEISELASFLMLFILVVDVTRSEKDVRTMVKFLVFSSLVPLTVGLVQIYSNFSLSAFTFEPSFRVYATLTHPNAYAFYLVMIAVLALSVYLQERVETNKLLLRLLLPLLVFSLLFTYTRGAWIGLLMAVALVGILQKRRLLVFIPLAVYSTVLIFPVIFHRFESVLNPELFKYDSLAWRLRLWGASFPHFLSHPVLGNGLGSFRLIAYQVDDWFAAAHNDYLRMLVETGLVGFVGYLILLVGVLRLSWRAYHRAVVRLHRQVCMGFFCFMVAYLAMSVADNLFNHGGIQWYLWAWAGVVTAVYRLNPKNGDRAECPSSQGS
jgi:putative inorganic carbon (HCO3(-)) transporter